jgi:hypothetical protein
MKRMSAHGTKQARAYATACPQPAKADTSSAASAGQLVNKGQYLFPAYEKYATTSPSAQ